MPDFLKLLLANQFEAALCTLGHCIHRCPDPVWNAPVANLAFCQVAFHTLFFVDYYLEAGAPVVETLQQHAFHRENADFFRDYEELQPRRQTLLYERADVQRYLAFCRQKAAGVIAGETEESLAARCAFPPKTFSRAELHVYTIRHVQHHAAQLALRLRLDAAVDIPWVGSGWRELPTL